MLNAMAFDVARLQILSGPMEFARGGLSETIRDALGNTASSTLHSRGGPLLRVSRVCRLRNGQPMTSSRLWEIQLLVFRDLSCCL